MGDVNALKKIQEKIGEIPLLREFLIDMTTSKLDDTQSKKAREQYLDFIVRTFTDARIAPYISELFIGGKIKNDKNLDATLNKLMQVENIAKVVSVSSLAKNKEDFKAVCERVKSAGCGMQLMLDVEKTESGIYLLRNDPDTDPLKLALQSQEIANGIFGDNMLPVQFSLVKKAGMTSGPDYEFLKLLQKEYSNKLTGEIAYSGGLELNASQIINLLKDYPIIQRVGIGKVLNETTQEEKQVFFTSIIENQKSIGGGLKI